MKTKHLLCLGAAATGAFVLLAPRSKPALAGEPAPCEAVDIEYATSANLELEDTPMGQGDGVYRIGPGKAVVRFEPGGVAKLVGYGMTERFDIKSKTLFWSTRVSTTSKTTVSADKCGVISTGALAGSTLTWSTDGRGYRTDGTLTCEGSLCGKFGAPPPGTSALHIPPHDVRLKPFVFGPDKKTFTMARTWVSHSESPKQTAFIALSGREIGRICKPPRAPGCE